MTEQKKVIIVVDPVWEQLKQQIVEAADAHAKSDEDQNIEDALGMTGYMEQEDARMDELIAELGNTGGCFTDELKVLVKFSRNIVEFTMLMQWMVSHQTVHNERQRHAALVTQAAMHSMLENAPQEVKDALARIKGEMKRE